MSHLNASDLIDVLDGTLPAGRAKHLETCVACREQVEAMRVTIESAAEVQVPEPSPLFWHHFSANVRQEIERRGDGRIWTPWLHGHRVLATVAAAAIVACVAVVWQMQRVVPSPSTVAADSRSDGSTALAAADDPESAAAWANVRAAAENMQWEEAEDAGLTTQPGAADTAVLGLTEKEREALLAVLEEELKGSGN